MGIHVLNLVLTEITRSGRKYTYINKRDFEVLKQGIKVHVTRNSIRQFEQKAKFLRVLKNFFETEYFTLKINHL